VSSTLGKMLVAQAETDGLDSTVQIVALIVTAVLLALVLELVRRRLLVERYALLWMVVAVTLLVLALWTDLLNWASELLGFQVPANFLFVAAFGVIFVLLLHFSVATSRLSEESKILAQQVARLDSELRSGRTNGTAPDDDAASAAATAAQQGQRQPPVEPQGRAE
jgi:hypothetical protein